MIYAQLGKRIKEERLKQHLTQEQLAEKTNLSTAYIGQIERAERNVSLDTLVYITNSLSVSIDYLLQDSIKIEDDVVINEIINILSLKPKEQKLLALDILKTLFSHLK